ncbi:MAG: SH3 domain-containing protein, partial [Arenicellales bacterium]
MNILRYFFLLLWASLFSVSITHAETLFVTDKILLGIHAEASEESQLIDSVPSGTAVEVLETAGAFKKVRLPNGKTGWVSSGYLLAEKPGSAEI